MNIKNKALKYGTKNLLSDEDFKPRNVKQRISIMIDQDILIAYKKKAKQEGLKYQTLINQALRKSAFTKNSRSVEKRLDRLEQAFYKKIK